MRGWSAASKLAVIALLAGYGAATTISCAGNLDAGGTESGVRGVVLLAPTCPGPVHHPSRPACADKPYQTKLVLIPVERVQKVRIFEAHQNGSFKVDTAPGLYIIRSAIRHAIGRCSSPGTIRVQKNRYTNVVIRCDTTIR